MSVKYVVVDIETTGLDPEKSQILEIAMVAEDLVSPIEELPAFVARIEHPAYYGDREALKMNDRLIEEIQAGSYVLNDEGFRKLKRVRWYSYPMSSDFSLWLESLGVGSNEKVVACGKNVAGFDLRFLKCNSHEIAGRFIHRVLDPGSLYYDPCIDIRPPSLAQCLERAGLPTEVKHTALADCKAVIQVMRHKLIGRL